MGPECNQNIGVVAFDAVERFESVKGVVLTVDDPFSALMEDDEGGFSKILRNGGGQCTCEPIQWCGAGLGAQGQKHPLPSTFVGRWHGRLRNFTIRLVWWIDRRRALSKGAGEGREVGEAEDAEEAEEATSRPDRVERVEAILRAQTWE